MGGRILDWEVIQSISCLSFGLDFVASALYAAKRRGKSHLRSTFPFTLPPAKKKKKEQKSQLLSLSPFPFPLLFTCDVNDGYRRMIDDAYPRMVDG
jgi:hypothetical protein